MIHTTHFKHGKEVIAELSYSLSDYPNTIYVISVWVDENHRGQGMATKLLLDLLQQYVTKKVRLECTVSSKKVWQRLGFSFDGFVSTTTAKHLLTYNADKL